LKKSALLTSNEFVSPFPSNRNAETAKAGRKTENSTPHGLMSKEIPKERIFKWSTFTVYIQKKRQVKNNCPDILNTL
jgi:hypothetical protein